MDIGNRNIINVHIACVFNSICVGDCLARLNIRGIVSHFGQGHGWSDSHIDRFVKIIGVGYQINLITSRCRRCIRKSRWIRRIDCTNKRQRSCITYCKRTNCPQARASIIRPTG